MIKYNACDFFMTRIPLISVDGYLAMFDDVSSDSGMRLKNAFEDPVLKEALAVASDDLLNATINSDLEVKSKSSNQIRSSLTKYFIRLSTRPTPFGLFSGISVGQFGNASNITISDSRRNAKRVRPDMEWIYGIIKKMEADRTIRSHLNVRFNDFTFANGSRIEKPNKSFLQLEESNDDMPELSTSIRYTGQVKAIESKCSKFHSFSDILEEIVGQNPNAPMNKIETFLSQLLENEYLLSEFRPPLINSDMLEYLLHVLDRIKDIEEVDVYIQKLKAILKSIADYNAVPIGEGMDIYNETLRLQKDLHDCKNYLQIDMKTHAQSNMLDLGLKKELEQFVSAMIRIAPIEKTSDEMARYVELFIERYGHSAEVCLLELLDVDKGLGAPAHFQADKVNHIVPKRQKSQKEQRINAMLERKIMLALREDKRSIAITDSDIDYICGEELLNGVNQPMDCSQSFELFLLPHPEADHKFTFVSMSDNFGKTFGRFSDMLTEEETLMLKEGFEKIKNLHDEYVIVEIAELPASGRVSNVSINNSDYDYQIALATNPCEGKCVLSVRDIYIGVDPANNQFYIKSRSLDKKLIVTMTSMLNPTYSSNALRFLTEISTMRRKRIAEGIYAIFNLPYEYCPRIVYNKIILRPETWTISKDILGIKQNAKKNSDKEVIKEQFEQFRIKWDMPRYVFLNEGDNRLLIDLDNTDHRNEVYNVIKKDSIMPVTLTELTCDFGDHVAKNADGEKYITEIVVPFILADDQKISTAKTKESSKDKVLKTLSNVSENRMNIDREQLVLLPGNDEWLYYKLYGCSKRQDELIAESYHTLEKLVSDGMAQKYFYIRYADPEPHLRLRIQPPKNGTPSLFAALSGWIRVLYNDGIISNAVNDSYTREAERYGGSKLIHHAEDYFYYDSKLAMNLLFMQRYRQQNLSMDYVGISFIISVLRAFGLDMEAQEMFLASLTDKKNYSKEFQKDRQMIMRAVDSSDDWFDIRSSISYSEVYDLINANAQELKKYAQAIYDSDQQGELTSPIRSIVTSIIHMFCNRLKGNNAWEQKMYALTMHGIRNLNGFLKHNPKEELIVDLPDSLI
ncbi:MAG: lantibiotic dehydratase [Oscillospiraceae bacterium]|nr:lantibiotic dehydratase [Oscillospiraceae bacterium]